MYDGRKKSPSSSSSKSSSLLVDYSRGKGTVVRGDHQQGKPNRRRERTLLGDDSCSSLCRPICADELSQSFHEDSSMTEEEQTPVTFRIRKTLTINRTYSCPKSLDAAARKCKTMKRTAASESSSNDNDEVMLMRRSMSSDDATSMMMMNMSLDHNSSHHDRFAASMMRNNNKQWDLSDPIHRTGRRSPSPVPLGLRKNPLQSSEHSVRSLSPASTKPMIDSSSSSHHRRRSKSPISRSRSSQSLENTASSSIHSRRQRPRTGLRRSTSYQQKDMKNSSSIRNLSSRSLLSSSSSSSSNLSSRSLNKPTASAPNNVESWASPLDNNTSCHLHHSEPSTIFGGSGADSSSSSSLLLLNFSSSNHFVTGSRIRRHTGRGLHVVGA